MTIGLVLAAGLTTGVGAGWLLFDDADPAPPVVAATITADSSFRASNICCGPSLAISRDGRTVAFYGEGPGESRIFVHLLNEFGSRPVPGTENARAPFLSPDGRWLGFLQGSELRKVDLQGGSPVTLAAVPGAKGIQGADWTDQGQIYFGNADEGRIYRVSVQGGPAAPVMPVDTVWSAGMPQLLPGGRSLLFSRWRGTRGQYETELAILDLGSGEVHRLNGDQSGLFSGVGFLVSARRDGSLMAQRFDPRSRKLSGEPVRIGEGIIAHAPDPEAEFAVSATGSLVYRRGSQAETTLEEFSIDGAPIAVHPAKGWSRQPSYSQDGRQIAFVQAREDHVGHDIWVLDLGSGIATQLSSGGRDENPVWSPDGRFVLWSAGVDGDSLVLMRRRADLSADAEPLGRGVSGLLGVPAQSPGPMPFTHVSRMRADGIWIVGQDGANPHPWRATHRGERSPALSPSGRWIAYESGQSGRTEVYVEPFPAGGAVTQISKSGGEAPVWATDGRLLFRTPATGLMRVDVDLAAERPRPTGYRDLVWAAEQSSQLGAHAMSVSPDGERVVLLRQGGAPVILLEVNRLRHLSGDGTR